MQNRMKTHALDRHAAEALLDRAPCGALCTLGADGVPYPTPVHFVREGDRLYVHSLPQGTRMNNIASHPQVGFTAWEMDGLLLDPAGSPCNTNTAYHSVIAAGRASLVETEEEKARILGLIVGKYTPQLAGKPLPANMVRGTAVLRVDLESLTGKFYG